MNVEVIALAKIGGNAVMLPRLLFKKQFILFCLLKKPVEVSVNLLWFCVVLTWSTQLIL